MTDTPLDHIVTFQEQRPDLSICGERPQYTREPRTGQWTSRDTGNPPLHLGEQWDHPAGDLCPNCLILTLTLGDDTSELSHWIDRPASADKPIDIAEAALRGIEIIEMDTQQPPAETPKPQAKKGPAPGKPARRRRGRASPVAI